MTGALGATLRIMNWFERALMPGDRDPYWLFHVVAWSLTPIALALGATIPIVILGNIVRRRSERAAAEVRAIARVLAEHAAERIAAKKK
jgi:hypothetical protein